MKQRNQSPVLVTGGTGRQGGSGRAVIRTLIAAGRPVRALVRKMDERAEALNGLGAELVIGDYTDYPSMLHALDGVEEAYFCYPVGAGLTEAAGMFANAGLDRGLKRIIDLSLAAARPDSPSPAARAQWVAEKIFEWAGFAGTHLRIAAFFMENVRLIHGYDIRANGRIANSFGDYPVAWISGQDVGALAAVLLLDPKFNAERTIVAGGVERLTYTEVASIIAEVRGQPVRYEEVSPELWREELIAASRARGAENVRGADHLTAQSVALRARDPLPITDHVHRLVGRDPTSFRTFASENRAHFSDL